MVRISKDPDESIEGEHVLLVEDIIDTGFTTRYLLQHLSARGPKSLAVCTLLDRRRGASCKSLWITAVLRFRTVLWWFWTRLSPDVSEFEVCGGAEILSWG